MAETPDLYAAFRFANEIESEPLLWLWPARIPLGKLTLLIGDPGTGKSLLIADLAARVSAGRPWPDAPTPPPPLVPQSLNPSIPPRPPTAVVLVCPEDSAGDTLQPRLSAAGANLALVCLLDGVTGTYPSSLGPRVPSCLPLTLPDHLPILAEAVRAVTCPRLVILDPLHALLSPAAQASADGLAKTLAGLADIARSYGVAIVAVGHLSKTSAHRTLYRVRGSLALVAAARSVLLLTADPDRSDRRILAPLKTVYGPPPPPLALRIAPGPRLEWNPPGPVFGSATDPPVLTTCTDLLDLSPDAHSALSEACAWLPDFLSAGPRPVYEVLRAARASAISLRTLQRAKRLLAIRSVRPAHDSPWFWSLEQRPDNKHRQQGGV